MNTALEALRALRLVKEAIDNITVQVDEVSDAAALHCLLHEAVTVDQHTLTLRQHAARRLRGFPIEDPEDAA